MQALWNGTVIASSDDIVTVEGNAYFPVVAKRLDGWLNSFTQNARIRML